MRKFELPPEVIAAMAAARTPHREVCVPLYLPALEDDRRLAEPPREIDADDLVVDASGLTIGGDDDFY